MTPKSRWSNDPTPQGQAERAFCPRCRATLKISAKGKQFCPQLHCRWPQGAPVPATPAEVKGGIDYEKIYLYFIFPSVLLAGMLFYGKSQNQHFFDPPVTVSQPAPTPQRSIAEREREARRDQERQERAKRACRIGGHVSPAQMECFKREFLRQR